MFSFDIPVFVLWKLATLYKYLLYGLPWKHATRCSVPQTSQTYIMTSFLRKKRIKEKKQQKENKIVTIICTTYKIIIVINEKAPVIVIQNTRIDTITVFTKLDCFYHKYHGIFLANKKNYQFCYLKNIKMPSMSIFHK